LVFIFPDKVLGWIGNTVTFGEHLKIQEIVQETEGKAKEAGGKQKEFLAPLEKIPSEGGYKKGLAWGQALKQKLQPVKKKDIEKIKGLSQEGGDQIDIGGSPYEEEDDEPGSSNDDWD